MCLVLVAWNVHPRYPLVIAANRDEDHARPAAPAGWWEDAPDVLGGRDLVGGGSWLSVRRDGRYALVLNQPARPPALAGSASRGHLVREWVMADAVAAPGYLQRVGERAAGYAGFTLVVGSAIGSGGPEGFVTPAGPTGAHWRFAEGLTALSNSAREEPLPKALWLEDQARTLLADAGDPLQLFAVLARREPVVATPAAGPGGRLRTTPFLVGERYGTRASTVVAVAADGHCRFVERRFRAGGEPGGETAVEFDLEG